MLVLHQCRPVRGQASLLQVREHVEEVHGRDELHHGVPQELQPLVVGDGGLSLPPTAEAGHDADEHVDAALAVAGHVDLEKCQGVSIQKEKMQNRQSTFLSPYSGCLMPQLLSVLRA